MLSGLIKTEQDAIYQAFNISEWMERNLLWSVLEYKWLQTNTTSQQTVPSGYYMKPSG